MRERIDGILGNGTGDSMWVSTFHSMCVRILRRNIDQLGISRNFSILDSTDQLSVIKNVMKDENIDTKRFEPRAILNAISSAKTNVKLRTIMQVKSMKITLTKNDSPCL